MRKLTKLLVVLVGVLLPVCASAMTETEWNRSCWSKTRNSLTVYQREETGAATATDLEPAWRAVDSLPAGAYVKRSSRNDDIGHIYISYWKNGSVNGGYVKMSSYPLEGAGAYVKVVMDNGYIGVTEVPEAYLDDADALRKYIKEYRTDCRLLESGEQDQLVEGKNDSMYLPGESSSTQSTKPTTSTTKKSTKKKVEKMTLDISLAVEGETLPVTVKQLGVHESIVKLDGKETTVPTTQLRYETTAAGENALAIIYAKNTGEVILRPQQETTGRVTKCKTGRVALVIEKGKSWSKLWYDGHVGYVQNKYLQFIPMAEAATDAAVGGKNAPLHLGTHRDTRVVKQVKKGTPIEKLWQGETWAEVAVEGYRGYIQLKYLAE